MFYAKRTVEEQKNRLPSLFQSNYEATQLDRLEIDGNVFQGYFEYSYLAEKAYKTQPVRSNDGSIPDINQYATFLTPRLVIKYNMMDIELPDGSKPRSDANYKRNYIAGRYGAIPYIINE